MPRISEFYGIVIKHLLQERAPSSPFPCGYSGDEASFVIHDTEQFEGRLPPRAYRLVREWADLHRAELMANWELARSKRPLIQIEPLP